MLTPVAVQASGDVHLPPFTFAPCCMLTPVAVQATDDVHLPPFTLAPFCAARKKRPKPWTPWRLPPFTFAPCRLRTCYPTTEPQKTQRDVQLHLHVCNVPFSETSEDALHL
jgi:hypothetical protein